MADSPTDPPADIHEDEEEEEEGETTRRRTHRSRFQGSRSGGGEREDFGAPDARGFISAGRLRSFEQDNEARLRSRQHMMHSAGSSAVPEDVFSLQRGQVMSFDAMGRLDAYCKAVVQHREVSREARGSPLSTRWNPSDNPPKPTHLCMLYHHHRPPGIRVALFPRTVSTSPQDNFLGGGLGSNDTIRYSLDQLEEGPEGFEFNEGTETIVLRFTDREMVAVVLNFPNFHDFSVFRNFILEVRRETNRIVEVRARGQRGSIVNPSDFKGSVSGNVSKSMSAWRQNQEETLFLTTPYNTWNGQQVIEWSKLVHFQEYPPTGEIISLYSKFVEMGIVTVIRDSLAGQINLLSVRDLFQAFVTNPDHLTDHPLLPLLLQRAVTDRILELMEDMDETGQMFFESKFRVLEKMIRHKTVHAKAGTGSTAPVLPQSPNLKNLELSLKFTRRYLWDANDCKRSILFALLFNKSISKFIDDHACEFTEFENVLVDEGTDLSFVEMLEKYNDLNQLKVTYTGEDAFGLVEGQEDLGLQTLNLDVFLDAKAQKLEDDLILRQKVLKPLKIERDRLLKEKNETVKFIERAKKLLSRPGARAMVERKIAQYGNQLTDVDEKLAVFLGQNGEDIERQEATIRKIRNELNQISEAQEDDSEVRLEWALRLLRSPKRLFLIEELIRNQMTEIAREGGFTLTVKLVLSKLKNIPPKSYRTLAKILVDPFLRPAFYKFGFCHASFSIKNCHFHWFDNHLILFKEMSAADQYEEILCVDVDCPILYTYDDLEQKILELSKRLVLWNSEYTYCPFKVWPDWMNKGSKEKNCQEFVMDSLEVLRASEHYTEVLDFVSGIKTKLSALNAEQNLDDLMTFEATPTFYSRYQSAFTSHRAQDCVDRNSIVFRTHQDLDYFMNSLLSLNFDFPEEAPGVYALLKGFDRAYHMRLKKSQNKEDPVLVWSPHGCPFNRRDPSRMEMLQADDGRY